MQQFAVNNTPSQSLAQNASEMRAYHEKLVLSILRANGPLPKAEIAKCTHLSAQSVSIIMRELETRGLLLRGDPIRGKVGQPSIPLFLNPDGAFFYGLNIGRRSVELILINFLGEIKAHKRKNYHYPTISKIIDFVNFAVQEFREILPVEVPDKIRGMGVAMPFDLWKWAEVIGVNPEAMAHWKTENITDSLSELFDFPIYLQNDATSACGAELTFGGQKLPANFLYIYVGYFVGGGLVLNNRLFTGATGNAALLATMPVFSKDNGQSQLIDTSSIARLEKDLIAQNFDAQILWNNLDAWDLPTALLDNWVNYAAQGLAQAIISACSIVDFETIVIDGWMPRNLCHQLVQKTTEEIDKFAHIGMNQPMIVSGSLGSTARPVGAASLPLFDQYMIEFNRSIDIENAQ